MLLPTALTRFSSLWDIEREAMSTIRSFQQAILKRGFSCFDPVLHKHHDIVSHNATSAKVSVQAAVTHSFQGRENLNIMSPEYGGGTVAFNGSGVAALERDDYIE